MRRPLSVLALCAIAFACPLLAQQSPIKYPDAPKSDQTDDYHGTRVADPYRWLEDVDSPATKAWVEAQNRVTFDYLSGIPERGPLKERLTKLWNYAKFGTPFKEGGKLFWTENTGLQNQFVLFVQDNPKAKQRVLIDPNTMSTDGTVALSGLSVSPNGKYIAYATSASGSDWQQIQVRDIGTLKDLPDTTMWVKFSGIEWTEDSKGFFYSRFPEPKDGNKYISVSKNQKLYYHRIGTPQSEDVLIYEDPAHPEWRVDAEVSEDGQYLMLYIIHGTDERNDLYVMDMRNPKKPTIDAPLMRIFDRFDATYDYIDNVGNRFFFRTTNGAPKGRVISLNLNFPRESAWRTVIPENKDALIDASAFGNRIVARYLQDARGSIRIFSRAGGMVGEVPLPGIGAVGGVNGKKGDPELYYSFTSFLYPTTIFKYNLATKSNTVHRAPKVAFDVDKYETKQVFYASKDGTRIPMFITMRKGTVLDGNNPTLLYAYGGFNISMQPSFNVRNLVWLEMGGIYAMPNLRGGGEYGEEWHKAGMFEKKQNVFDDYIAAAEYLIREKYTSPSKLAISGGSNGGLLVGAVLNQRPELFGVALPAVGVMDMLRYHRFTIGHAWAAEYGSADSAQYFPVLYKYSPLHNIKPGTSYPATLVTTADHDDRVVPGHSFKYAAALQAAQAGPAPILIRIETKSGHGAGRPTSKVIEEAADVLAFTMKNLGVNAAVTP